MDDFVRQCTAVEYAPRAQAFQFGARRRAADECIDTFAAQGLCVLLQGQDDQLQLFAFEPDLIALRGRPRTSSAGKDSAGREAVLYSKLYR